MSKQLPVFHISAGGCCTPIAAGPLTADVAVDLARGFTALGDPVRLPSLTAGRAGGEVRVCDLTEAFDVTGPTISHHLRVLHEAGLIDCQRRGSWVYYWIILPVVRALSMPLGTSIMTASA